MTQSDDAAPATAAAVTAVLRRHAEQEYAEELAALAEADDRPRPPSWKLSPWAVRTYLLGRQAGRAASRCAPKYIGSARLIEIAVATLATDRALLLLGVPGTAKSWVSEHLAAAVSGDSTLLVQGTAGTDENALRYGWNYARLLAEGPTAGALVPSPLMRAMRDRQDRAHRGADPHPQRGAGRADHHPLGEDAAGPRAGDRGAGAQGLQRHRHRQQPRPGRQRAVQRAPAPLQHRGAAAARDPRGRGGHRQPRVADLGRALELPAETPALEEIRRLVTIFRELRSGVTEDGKTRLKTPSGTLSTAEAISVVNSGLALAAYFGDGVLRAADVAAGLTGAIVKDPVQDRVVWLEYLETVVKERDGWKDLYRSCKDVL